MEPRIHPRSHCWRSHPGARTKNTVMFLFVLIIMQSICRVDAGSFTVSAQVIMWLQRGSEVQWTFNKHASPANSHAARGFQSVQCWTGWISFNLPSCWFDWDCSRTHYTLSVSRRSLCLFPACLCLAVIAELIFFFFLSTCKGKKSKVDKKQSREKQRCGIGINVTICSPVFSFLDYKQFFRLCNELATCYCNKKLDIEHKVSGGEFVDMHQC